ncbi:MAG: hypothetical protein H0X51_04405 [Parachlamydiaceae bacterium]|nr:hypothetical protein [Parachlamydiaceae bacterium]
MSWKPIDFHGIVSLDTPLVDLLQSYIDEKESEVAYTILRALPLSENAPNLTPERTTDLKLSDAVEVFTKQNYQDGDPSPAISLEEWNASVKRINTALWSYVETIEGCISELFQQLDAIGLEQWHTRLAQVVTSIKDLLSHKMEDLAWSIRRLEIQLRKGRQACEAPNSLQLLWTKVSYLWNSILDRSLLSHLKKNQEQLRSQYNKFMQRYRGFLQLQEQVDKSIEKLSNYQTLTSMDQEVGESFVKLYHLLKLWELNRTAKALPEREFIIALRNTMGVDKAALLFKDYHAALSKQLFEKSLHIKQHADDVTEDSPHRQLLLNQVSGYQTEAHLLGATIAHYREFLLRADPDPYVSTRLGFSDWVVGPEPIQTKPLLNLGYDVEALSELLERFEHAINKDPSQQQMDRANLDQAVQESLHEMSHPLATHRQMRSEAEKILNTMQQLDELGSTDENSIFYFNQVFAKLLRADWKYHVVFGFPLFHQLFAIHKGLLPAIQDRHHAVRLIKFKKLLQQILEWVKAQKTQAHAHDIELDMNDIKGYLQDFLGYLQRIINDSHLTKEKASQLKQEVAQELLEYRYLFGNFFYRLRQNETEGPLIRRQFLFVDQYFETIEYKLHELSQRSWPEPEQDSAEHGEHLDEED